MSKTANLQKKIALLRLELRMLQLVNNQLMAEVVDGNRIISLLESDVSRLQDRICCHGHDDTQQEMDEHFVRNYAEGMKKDPEEVQAEV